MFLQLDCTNSLDDFEHIGSILYFSKIYRMSLTVMLCAHLLTSVNKIPLYNTDLHNWLTTILQKNVGI